jgi:hypothetical protein
MNPLRKMFTCWLIIFCYFNIILFTGCAPTVSLRSIRDVEEIFNKDGHLFVAEPDQMSLEEKNFSISLVKELKHADLKLVTKLASADYVLDFRVTDYEVIGQSLNYEPEIVDYYCSLNPTQAPLPAIGYRPVSYLHIYPNKKITLRLFNKKAYLKHKHVPIWEGYLVAHQEIYRTNLINIISVLTNYLGKDYLGKIAFNQIY